MTESASAAGAPSLAVTLAGVPFRSPIGLAPVGGGSHFGRPDADVGREAEITLRFLLDHVRAGSNCLYLNVSYLTEATLRKLQGGVLPHGPSAQPAAWAERFLKAVTPAAPYGVEGLYSMVTPGPGTPELHLEEERLQWQRWLVAALRQELPAGVPLVGGVIGCGGLPDAYVDAAIKCEELGFDLIEVNFHCPLQAGMRGAVENTAKRRFPAFSQAGLIAGHPDLVEEIVREVVAAVKTPVGVKFSAEAGFPGIVYLAERVQEAGARYIGVGGAGVGIAPPDIYNKGKPVWPFADGSPFCLSSGSWMRRICYRDVAAVARFVPGLDIMASGGLVTPEHCVEAMMLGATLTQICAGVMEQGRGLLRRTHRFLGSFLAEQGYAGADGLIGLAQSYIGYPEDLDLQSGQVVVTIDQKACDRCGRCVDNLCVALRTEEGKTTVDEGRCTGCGACTIACRSGALSLVPKRGEGEEIRLDRLR